LSIFYACLFPLPINHAHQALYQLQLADATQENHFFTFAMFTALCRIFVIGRIFGSIFLPNIRFRPKQENPFSVDHYSELPFGFSLRFAHPPGVKATKKLIQVPRHVSHNPDRVFFPLLFRE
jgi:hypothetical protein